MNKNAIQRFAIWARTELISQVSQRAYQYDIKVDGYGEYDAEAVGGRLLSKDEKKQRQQLINQIRSNGYTQVMEEVAYTWFNRFIALRFMEVNNYLPTHIRVFSDASGAFKPEILSNALHLDLDGLNMEKVSDLIEKNQSEDLYRYLLLTQCNALNASLPRMFEEMGSYTELLLPNNILRQDGVLGRMVSDIPEEDWTDQVQIIGWLYQYYNTELKDETFALLKKNEKITKECIPFVTQLFTPDWIVRYMVENSLGRLWLEGHPDDELKSGWKYYLDEAEQEAEVQAQLDAIRAERRDLRPQDIKLIDPCMGSGHILVYAFDVLVQIYKKAGFSERDAAQSILKNNLYGLDIDKRAAQLAYFAVMMKARQYDRRIFARDIQPNIFAIAESGHFEKVGKKVSVINPAAIEEFIGGRPEIKANYDLLFEQMFDAKEYGSVIRVEGVDFDALYARYDETVDEVSLYHQIFKEELLPLIQIAEMLSQKYDVAVTNPPYMGSGNMNSKLSEFVKNCYPDSKSDLSTAFMERTLFMCKSDGIMAMINIPVWMFLSSYEKLREKLIQDNIFISMVHPGRGIFGSDFGTTTFVIGKRQINGYMGQYRRLFDKQGEVETVEQREQHFFEGKGKFTANQSNFSKIPGSPVAYWVSEKFIRAFTDGSLLGDLIPVKKGMDTGDNDYFLRFWFEVSINKIDFLTHRLKWIPYDKGGDYRKWYGNNAYILNWGNDGYELMNSKANIRSKHLYFRKSITWSALSSSDTSFRYSAYNGAFDSAGSSMFPDEDHLNFFLGLMNTKVINYYLSVINPTLNYGAGSIALIPVMGKLSLDDDLVSDCISLSRTDWDSFETSWDFKVHPLIRCASFSREKMAEDAKHHIHDMNYIEDAFINWSNECYLRFTHLKENEEELNRIFIDIYGLQDELTPDVEDKDVTVRKADLQRDIRSFISYAVGCMFGRYSIYKEGLLFAGEPYSLQAFVEKLNERPETVSESEIIRAYTHEGVTVSEIFYPDPDNIIPICDDEYFDDDIVGRFVKFVETVYGKETLEENLQFIANALGGKGTPREVIRSYFLGDFYADHLKIYQKRPIYWLFDSGKKNGFKALIYMHRYQSDLLARMRTDYVHEQQERYRTQLGHIMDAMNSASASERVKLTKLQKKLQEQALELSKYEEKIHHLADQNIKIDLDDGVKVNYALFEDVLAKIK